MDVLKRLKSTNVGFGLIILGAILMAADIKLQTTGNILIAIGGSLLSSYFEQLWDDEENNNVLTRPVRSR